jgi:hypothetical protein
MIGDGDTIPAMDFHCGVKIQDAQPQERVALVRLEIDRILAISDVHELYQIAGDASWSPEARLLAASKVESTWEACAAGRAKRQ